MKPLEINNAVGIVSADEGFSNCVITPGGVVLAPRHTFEKDPDKFSRKIKFEGVCIIGDERVGIIFEGKNRHQDLVVGRHPDLRDLVNGIPIATSLNYDNLNIYGHQIRRLGKSRFKTIPIHTNVLNFWLSDFKNDKRFRHHTEEEIIMVVGKEAVKKLKEGTSGAAVIQTHLYINLPFIRDYFRSDKLVGIHTSNTKNGTVYAAYVPRYLSIDIE